MSARFSVGLTGGIGSGKTTVATMFGELGATIIDTDEIAHQLTQNGGAAIPSITSKFGSNFVLDGAMRRDKMRELVFRDPQAKQDLESILHPLIRQACEEQANQPHTCYPIFVVPLLVESGTWVQRVNRILVADCPVQTQIDRVVARNGFSREQIERILQAQASREQRLQAASDIINTELDLSHVRIEVTRLHTIYQKLALSS